MRLPRILPVTCIFASAAYACATAGNDDPANLAGDAGLDTGSSIRPTVDGSIPYDAGSNPIDSAVTLFDTGPVEAAPPAEGGACGAAGQLCDPDAFGFGAPNSCPFGYGCEEVIPQSFPRPDAGDAGDASADGGDAAAPLRGVCLPISFVDPGSCNQGTDHCPGPDAGADASTDASADAGDAAPVHSCLLPAHRCLTPDQVPCICTAHPEYCGAP